MFSLPSRHFDELVEQAAPGFAPRHTRIPAAHLFGVRFNEATRTLFAVAFSTAFFDNCCVLSERDA